MSEYEDYNSFIQQEKCIKQTTSKPTEIDKLKQEIERLNNIIDKKEQFLGDNIKRLERKVVKRDNIINEALESITYYDNDTKRKEPIFEEFRAVMKILMGSDKE